MAVFGDCCPAVSPERQAPRLARAHGQRSALHPIRLVTLAWLLTLLAASSAPHIANIRPLSLHDGVNTVPAFLPDGSAATIVQAWRANGNAHGHHDWLVLAPSAEGHGAAEVTLVDPRSKMLGGVIGDAPFDGERVLGSVRFARGVVEGRPASLLLKAELNEAPSGIPADHVTATVRIFRLEATDGAPGDSPLEFRPLSSTTTIRRYCNAELAMSQALSVPLPADYGGPNRVDGCFAS